MQVLDLLGMDYLIKQAVPLLAGVVAASCRLQFPPTSAEHKLDSATFLQVQLPRHTDVSVASRPKLPCRICSAL
jgi:hypothetical protein